MATQNRLFPAEWPRVTAMRNSVRYLPRAWRRVGVVAAAAVLGSVLAAGTAAGATAGGAWGSAREVAGVGAGGSAGIASISCGAAGNCAAGGSYDTNKTACNYVGCHFSAFLVTEVGGTWGRAAKVAGMSTLNRGRQAGIGPVSCPAAGTCTAGGSYTDGAKHSQAFIVTEAKGKWGTAREVPGTAALNKGGSAGVSSVSCPAAGTCTAGGNYTDAAKHGQAYVITETKGKWGTATEMPGLGGLNWVSCPSVGNCTAASGSLVISEVAGHWGTPAQIPGLAALQASGYPGLSGLSCGAPGNCAATLNYTDQVGNQYAYVANQVNGTWGKLTKVPGMLALNPGPIGGQGQIDTVSCSSAGNCSAGGLSGENNGFDVNGGGQPFVVSEVNGTWHKALTPAGMSKLNSGADGTTDAVACASAGNCAAVGFYGVGQAGNKVYNLETFVVSQVKGTWGKAEEIPGTAALNKGQWSGIGAVACGAPSRCAAGGDYQPARDESNISLAFVVSQG
jgi:hypothetical protein